MPWDIGLLDHFQGSNLHHPDGFLQCPLSSSRYHTHELRTYAAASLGSKHFTNFNLQNVFATEDIEPEEQPGFSWNNKEANKEEALKIISQAPKICFP